jgi:hypothetical protein
MRGNSGIIKESPFVIIGVEKYIFNLELKDTRDLESQLERGGVLGRFDGVDRLARAMGELSQLLLSHLVVLKAQLTYSVGESGLDHGNTPFRDRLVNRKI